jgi:hypothetical protein
VTVRIHGPRRAFAGRVPRRDVLDVLFGTVTSLDARHVLSNPQAACTLLRW